MLYNRQIILTVGANRQATAWMPQSVWLSDFYARLQNPSRSAEAQQDYLRMPKAQQDNLKDVGGYVAGPLSGTRRKAGAVTGRDIITLDLDNIPAGQTEDVLRRVEALGCGYAVHSTRKHHPAAPRLRVLLPTDRTMSADEYEPCARRVAETIGISLCDPSTFEVNRLMFWPTASADGEYVFLVGDKPFLSVDGLLATYADWHDVQSWPTCPGAMPMTQRAARQGDPTEKKGVVGAFCKAYDIPAAMDKFLPGVYVPCDNDPNRFTFAGGSTTGGAVVYDDGKFLYSHHATDPCSQRLVNAFDLVRLHRFGHMDDEADPGTPTNRLPSYKAVCELAAQDDDIRKLVMDERWDKVHEAFQTLPETAADAGEWKKQLEIDENLRPRKTLENLRIAMELNPELSRKLRQNLFSGRIDVVGELPWQRPVSTAVWSDEDSAQLRMYMERFFGKLAKNDLLDVVCAVASNQAYHPVRDYLNGLIWDGKERLDTMFIDYMGAEDSPYTRAVTRKSFVAAVARVMRPGCKYDTMLVLVGTQGRYKSSILAKMGGEWFSDSLRTFGDKEAMETIQGMWINEIGEMQAMNKSDIGAVKAFLVKKTDYYRAAYGRYTAERPRQCVFFGTTNSRDCLTDPTGGRRFWPLDIDQRPRTKDVWKDLDAERDQLWAEAVVRWRQGESLHLPKELEVVAKVVQEEHRQRNPWEGIIADFVEKEVPEDWSGWDLNRRQMFWGGNAHYEGTLVRRERVCAAEIWCEALGKQKGDLKKSDSREINELLARMPGWESAGTQKAGKPYGAQRCFFHRGG